MFKEMGTLTGDSMLFNFVFMNDVKSSHSSPCHRAYH